MATTEGVPWTADTGREDTAKMYGTRQTRQLSVTAWDDKRVVRTNARKWVTKRAVAGLCPGATAAGEAEPGRHLVCVRMIPTIWFT